MNDGQAILRTIREFPDQDTPRLVYADWLDDHGDSERAEYIRLAIEASQAEDEDSVAPEIRERLEDLESEYQSQWIGPLAKSLAKSENASFHRGFVNSLSLRLSKKSQFPHLAQLLEWHPVEHLYLEPSGQFDANEILTQLAAMSSMDTVRSMGIHSHHARPVTQGMAAFGASKHLRHLKSVTLHIYASIEAITAFCREPLIRNLQSLKWWSTRSQGLDVAHFLGSTDAVADLETFGISCSDIQDHGLRALLANRNWRNLKHLDVAANAIGEPGITALSRSPWLEQLESLDLAMNDIPGVGIRNLVSQEAFAGVQCLELSNNFPFTDTGLWELANSRNSHGLKELDVGYCQLTENAASLLADTRHLSGLRILKINGTPLGSAGVEILSQAPFAAMLEHLELSNCQISEEGARVLVTRFPGLKSLYLWSNPLAGRGTEILRERFGNKVYC